MTARPPVAVVRGDVVLPDAVLRDAAVVVLDGRVAWVGPVVDVPADVRAAGLPDIPPAGTLVLPGLVDLHCHGGGGVSLPDATTPDEVRRAADDHLRHGTTTLVASLVTAPPDDLLARAALLGEAADAGVVAGVHVEGPFLAAARCGAQDPRHLRAGDPGLVRDLAAAARGHLVTMTVAPEVPGVADGGGDVLAALVAAGALPSLGHTDASADVAAEALARAADLLAGTGRRPTATHLFNGMRPLHHRDPGPVAACLAAAARGGLVVELVADGTHLAPATVRMVLDLVGPGVLAPGAGATAATGMPDGDYRLGPTAVRVTDGVARVADGPHAGAVAGGTDHLIDVVRSSVAAGVRLVDAVRAASLTPAEVLGRRDVGALEVGRRADLVVTSADLVVQRVVRGGVPVV